MRDWEGYQLLIFEWIMFASTLPFVGTRLYVQFYYRRRPCREVFTILAVICFLAISIADTVNVHTGYYNNDMDWEDPIKVTKTLKVDVVYAFCYATGPWCCKFALLCFYMDLMPRRHLFPKTWGMIFAAWVVSVGGCTYHFLFELTTCKKFSDLWNFYAENRGYHNWFIVSSWMIHIVAELLIYMIPFIIVTNLRNLSRSEKKGAYIMFAVGGVNVICCIALGALMSIPVTTKIDWETWNDFNSFIRGFWLASSIIIICLPQVRRLYLGTTAAAMMKSREKEVEPIHDSKLIQVESTEEEAITVLSKSLTLDGLSENSAAVQESYQV